MTEIPHYTPQPFVNLLPEPSQRLVREHKRVRFNNERARNRGRLGTLQLFEWIAVLDRFNWHCAHCGGAFESIDHIVPIRAGGGTVIGNVVPSCDFCNNSRDRLECMYWQARAFQKALAEGEAAGLIG